MMTSLFCLIFSDTKTIQNTPKSACLPQPEEWRHRWIPTGQLRLPHILDGSLRRRCRSKFHYAWIQNSAPPAHQVEANDFWLVLEEPIWTIFEHLKSSIRSYKMENQKMEQPTRFTYYINYSLTYIFILTPFVEPKTSGCEMTALGFRWLSGCPTAALRAHCGVGFPHDVAMQDLARHGSLNILNLFVSHGLSSFFHIYFFPFK